MKFQIIGLWPVRAGYFVEAGSMLDFTGPRDKWDQNTRNAEGLQLPPGTLALDEDAEELLRKPSTARIVDQSTPQAVNKTLETQLKELQGG